MIKLWFVPEILVFVCEMSLKFDFGGRHACQVLFVCMEIEYTRNKTYKL